VRVRGLGGWGEEGRAGVGVRLRAARKGGSSPAVVDTGSGKDFDPFWIPYGKALDGGR
jgi:hypothetical protein